MEFSSILETISSTLKEVASKIINFVKENKLISMIGAAVVLLIILLIAVISSAGKNNEKKESVEIPQPLTTQTLVIPNGPETDNDYNISRKTQDKWEKEETDEWFTVPSEKEISSLSTSNENMIKEIIGAAP